MRLATRAAYWQPVLGIVLMTRPRDLALQAARLPSRLVAPHLSSRPIASQAFAAQEPARVSYSFALAPGLVLDGESAKAGDHQAAVAEAWRSARVPIVLGKVAPQTGWRAPGLHKAAERSSTALHAPRAQQSPHVCPQWYSFGHSCLPLLCGNRALRSFTPQSLLHGVYSPGSVASIAAPEVNPDEARP